MGSLRVRHDWATSLHFSLSWIGEGNGNPLQCSSLENPRDGGAWWAAVYGVAQSRTRLNRLSSSSSSVSVKPLPRHWVLSSKTVLVLLGPQRSLVHDECNHILLSLPVFSVCCLGCQYLLIDWNVQSLEMLTITQSFSEFYLTCAFQFQFFWLNMKSSLLSICDLRALAVVQVKWELKMKSLQHLVLNNFCVYMFLFFPSTLCILLTHLFILTNSLMYLEHPRISLFIESTLFNSP